MSERVTPIDERLYRQVMGRFATGITVITTRVDGRVHGMTANAFMAGSLEPPLCLISVKREARLHELLQISGSYGVSVLTEDQQHLSNHFAGRHIAGVRPEFRTLAGVPVLEHAAAVVAADVVERFGCGDHTLFVGYVREMASAPKPPLLFHAGRYARLDRGQPIEEFVPHTAW